MAWCTLIGAPPIAISAFLAIRRRWSGSIPRLAAGCLAAIAVVVGAAWLDLSFTSPIVNVACMAVAYLAYCFLAICAWDFRPWMLRVLALVVAAVPIAAGYLLGTVGVLALLFILGDYTEPPMQIAAMEDDLECRVTGWGMAASDSGYTVHLYKHWQAVPFIEREVARLVVNETNPGFGPSSASCADALAAKR